MFVGTLALPLIAGKAFFFLVIAFLLCLWIWLRALQGHAEKLTEVWQDLASDLDLQYLPARGPAFRRKPAEISGVAQGIPIRLSCYGLSSTFDTAIYTRWNAEFRPQGAFVLYVHRRNMLAKLATALGFDETEMEDSAFDLAYSTKTDDPSKARKLLSPEVRAKLLELRSAVILINDTGLNVVWPGQISDSQELKRGHAAVVELINSAMLLWPKEASPDSGRS